MKQFTDQILLAVYFDKNSKFCAKFRQNFPVGLLVAFHKDLNESGKNNFHVKQKARA